ncbi:MAG TPA: 50S ribosomal protein L11 methyltransferase [Chloroflexi bacterium]|nr:50S ribosomal protein L11 methyltransferase [Chloroflexota bacterium]
MQLKHELLNKGKMDWLEVSVQIDNESAEAVAEILSRYAHQGVAIEASPEGWNESGVIVRAYLPTNEQMWHTKQRIQEALGHLNQIRPVPPPSFRTVAEADWTELWKERLTVLHVGQRIVIQPSWKSYEPQPHEVVIQLDPGMAFGTGLHPTTQLCLLALEEMVAPGMSVLDMGAGSGILAIAAAKLGAAEVLAVDNDPVAVKTARENFQVNHVENGTALLGSLDDVMGDYDLVIVNILSHVIIDMLNNGLATRIRPRGKLVTTGIIAEQADDVIETMKQQTLMLVEQRYMEDWVSLIARRE